MKDISSSENPLLIPLINLTLLVAFTGILFNTLINPVWLEFSFVHLSYYIILVLIAAWGFALFYLWQAKQNTALFLKSHWQGIAFSFLLTSFIFTSTSQYFRVLSDETNVLSVAKSMTFSKRAENITEGKWYYYTFQPSNTTIDKRPVLFQTFVSVVYAFLGYRVDNAFVLNYFVLWAALFLLYLIIRSSLAPLWAFAGMLLLMSQPFMCLSATTAGFEVFNLLFIFASFLGLRYFLINPEHKTFLPLALTLIMLANIRYESCLFFIVVMVVLLLTRYVRLDFFKKSTAYALIPFFLLPLIWQRIIYLKEYDTDMPDGSWVKAFGIKSVALNAKLFFNYILDLSGKLGFSGATNAIGLIAVLLLAAAIIKRRRFSQKKQQVLFACSVISLLLLFVVILFYNQARMTQHPLNGRLYMPLLAAFSVLPVYLCAAISNYSARASRFFLAGALGLFIFYHPIAIKDYLSNRLMIIHDYRYELDFFRKHADKNMLIICGRPGQFVVYNYGAISFETANQEKTTILEQFKNNLFNKIYVIQEFNPQTNLPADSSAIDPSYHLRTVEELLSSRKNLIRISEVLHPGQKQ